MKKAVRMFITGNLQSMFTKLFFKEHADKNNVRGFYRKLDPGKIELFLEGQSMDVDKMIEICRKGPNYAQIRNVELKDERLQDFKEFKVLNF